MSSLYRITSLFKCSVRARGSAVRATRGAMAGCCVEARGACPAVRRDDNMGKSFTNGACPRGGVMGIDGPASICGAASTCRTATVTGTAS